MNKAVTVMSRVLAIISALSIVVLMLAITLDVIMRFVTRASLPGMIELAETCLVLSIFFGLALAGVRGEHVAVTLLADRLSAAWNRVFNIIVWVASTVFLAWMLWASILRAIESTERGEERFGLIRWPLWPMRWVIVIGFAALLLVALVNAIRTLTGRDPLGVASELEAAVRQTSDLGEEATAVDALERGDRTEAPPGAADPPDAHRASTPGTIPNTNRTTKGEGV